MEYAAIRHFADQKYCCALAQGRFLIRLEVKKGDAVRVVLHTQDKYLPLKLSDSRRTYAMEPAWSDGFRDYYEAVIDIDVVCLRYFFEIEDGAGTVAYYGSHQFYDEPITEIDRMYDCPQNLREEERFTLPAWAKNKVVYQIFPSRFASDQDVPEEVWYQAPISHKADLHGSLRGIIDRLDYLKTLGVDILYMTPVFASKSSHKYDTDDYYRIDPSFGTKEYLKELVRRAHGLGMYVILDGVFNHTSLDFFAFRDIREKGEKSQYLNWYYIKSFPLEMAWGKRPSFKTFSYFGGMPKLNLQNKETADYVIDVAVYWIRECGIDGWRLDVADEISHIFWRRFRQKVKEVKADALLVGEIWHFAGDFLEGDQWDSVMNYPFYHGILDLLVSGRMSAGEFLDRLGFMGGNLNPALQGYLWNFIDSHDTARFLHSVDHDGKRQRLAAALQLLLPGMPMVYYGDEVGMRGGRDPDCRRGMLWDENRQDRALFSYYQTLIRIRHQYPVLTEGALIAQSAQDDTGLIRMERRLGGEHITVLLHTKPGTVELPELKGEEELVGGGPFSGLLGGFETAVIMQSEKITPF